MNLENRIFLGLFLIVIIVWLALLSGAVNLYGHEERNLIYGLEPSFEGLEFMACFFLAGSSGGMTEIYFYRPLTYLFHRLNYIFIGVNPYSVNVSLFIIFAASLFFGYYVIKNIFKNKKIALISVILFAVYPLNASAFIESKDSGDLLALFFTMAALFFYQKEKLKTAVFLMFFAFFSKENSYILPLIFILYDLLIADISLIKSIKKNSFILVLSGLFFIFRFIFLFNSFFYSEHVSEVAFGLFQLFNKITEYFKGAGAYFAYVFFVCFIFVIFSTKFIKKHKKQLFFIFLWLILSFVPLLSSPVGGAFRGGPARILISAFIFSVVSGVFIYFLKIGLNKKIYYAVLITAVFSLSFNFAKNAVYWKKRVVFLHQNDLFIDKIEKDFLSSFLAKDYFIGDFKPGYEVNIEPFIFLNSFRFCPSVIFSFKRNIPAALTLKKEAYKRFGYLNELNLIEISRGDNYYKELNAALSEIFYDILIRDGEVFSKKLLYELIEAQLDFKNEFFLKVILYKDNFITARELENFLIKNTKKINEQDIYIKEKFFLALLFSDSNELPRIYLNLIEPKTLKEKTHYISLLYKNNIYKIYGHYLKPQTRHVFREGLSKKGLNINVF